MLFKETSLLLTAYALLGMLMRTLAGRAGARKRSLVALIVRDDRRGLARPCGAGYQDLLRQGRAALSRDISPTSLRYRSASQIVPRKPCRTPDREVRTSKRMSGNRPATPRIPAAAPDRTSPHRSGRQ